MECGFESLRFEIQPGRGGHFWCGSGDVVWRRLGGKVTFKPPEGKKSLINVCTRLLGDLAQARCGLDEVVWVYELPLLLLPTIHPLI